MILRLLLVVLISLMWKIDVFAVEGIAPETGNVSHGSVPVIVEAVSGDATVTPIVIRHPSEKTDGILDLVVLVEGNSTAIVDPFFRAPGLGFASLAVFDEDARDVRIVPVPRSAEVGLPVMGSVIVPQGGVVGTRLPLKVTPAPGGETVHYYCQLLLSAGCVAGDGRRLKSVEPNVAARSNAVEIGSYRQFSRFELLRFDSLLGRNQADEKETSTRIESSWHRIDQSKLLVTFWNRDHSAVNVFDPWLRYYVITDSPVELWISSGSTKTNLLRHGGVSDRPRRPNMRSFIPSGAIIGGLLDLPSHYALDAETRFELKVDHSVLED